MDIDKIILENYPQSMFTKFDFALASALSLTLNFGQAHATTSKTGVEIFPNEKPDARISQIVYLSRVLNPHSNLITDFPFIDMKDCKDAALDLSAQINEPVEAYCRIEETNRSYVCDARTNGFLPAGCIRLNL